MSLKSISGSEEGGLDRSTASEAPSLAGNGLNHQRTNSSLHVCWHRAATIDRKAHHASLQTMLSGYLLRRFKNSPGWQKLWVVFTSSCLYFYKSSEDDFPLASLPLLGYWVMRPDPEDDVNKKEFVFKLRFKNHVYFFRAESEYAFERYITKASFRGLIEWFLGGLKC